MRNTENFDEQGTHVFYYVKDSIDEVQGVFTMREISIFICVGKKGEEGLSLTESMKEVIHIPSYDENIPIIENYANKAKRTMACGF